MIVYRLSKKQFKDELSGRGAALKGARWNRPGTELIYTAESRALAMAEVAVHFSAGTVPYDYYMIEISVPDNMRRHEVAPADLPAKWNAWPHRRATQHIGDQFVAENDACLMRVPSAVVKGDFNLLINTGHKSFRRIKIKSTEPFPFDERLFY